MTNRTYALTGAKACIPGENPAEFDALLSDLMSEFQSPAASMRFAVEELAQLQWKLRRAADVGRDRCPGSLIVSARTAGPFTPSVTFTAAT